MHNNQKLLCNKDYKFRDTVSNFTVVKIDKERNSVIGTWLTRKNGENKLLYLMEIAWNLSTYLLSLLIANINTS